MLARVRQRPVSQRRAPSRESTPPNRWPASCLADGPSPRRAGLVAGGPAALLHGRRRPVAGHASSQSKHLKLSQKPFPLLPAGYLLLASILPPDFILYSEKGSIHVYYVTCYCSRQVSTSTRPQNQPLNQHTLQIPEVKMSTPRARDFIFSRV